MEQPYESSLKGHFLIAMPGLMDPNFFQSVTCISEHTPSGAFGLVINRPHQRLNARTLFRELEIDDRPEAESVPIFIGGPVHIGEVFILHGPPFGWEGCLQITSALALSNTKDILEAIATGGGPESYIITLGCAGWGEGQLEAEIRQNAWITTPVDEDIIFNVPFEERWEMTMKKMGINPSLLSDTAGHA